MGSVSVNVSVFLRFPLSGQRIEATSLADWGTPAVGTLSKEGKGSCGDDAAEFGEQGFGRNTKLAVAMNCYYTNPSTGTSRTRAIDRRSGCAGKNEPPIHLLLVVVHRA